MAGFCLGRLLFFLSFSFSLSLPLNALFALDQSVGQRERSTGSTQVWISSHFLPQLMLLLVLSLLASVRGDCYMHNPRGSNNRLNGNNENRDNNNVRRFAFACCLA